MLSQINQTEKDKYCMISHIWNLKKYNKLVNKTKYKQIHRYREGERKEVVAIRGRGIKGYCEII